jgi:hypothetical protein
MILLVPNSDLLRPHRIAFDDGRQELASSMVSGNCHLRYGYVIDVRRARPGARAVAGK